MTGKLLVLGASLLWIAFCMRFWSAIDRDNVWQRRMIAIGAGLGGGLIYLLGTMMLTLQEPVEIPEQDTEGAPLEMRVKRADEAKK